MYWRVGHFLLAVLALTLAGRASAAVAIDEVWLNTEGDHQRVVFEVDEAPEHELFTLSDPERVVIDFKQGELKAEELPSGGLVESVRSGRQADGELRIVLDVAEPVQERSFIIGGQDGGQRLVVDLDRKSRARDQRVVRSAAEAGSQDVVVAIDPGHGGVDPGAVGPAGTPEKGILLEVSRRLKALMDEASGLEPVLIRDGDYYLGLRDRTRKAREADADIFLSLHADGSEDPSVQGASVYALSLDGATSEQARVLAQRENAADYLEVSLSDKPENVASTLVDLRRGHTIEASLAMGQELLPQLDRHADLLHRDVEQAGFVVLKSLDMPSLLVELGFITNPSEERRLQQPSYQRALAESILNGVQAYTEDHIVTERRIAERSSGGGPSRHTVERGESLSSIARQYHVGVDQLRSANGLSGDYIRAGTTLIIP